MKLTLPQKLVRWAVTPNGAGGYSYGTATEINCRWEERTVKFLSKDNKEEISRALISVESDVAVGDYIYLGALSSLTTAQKSDPILVDAWQVRSFRKSPSLRGGEYVREAII